MAVPSLEPNREGQTDRYPLLMEHPDNHNDREHVIDIVRGDDASSSGSSHGDPSPGMDLPQHDDRPSSSTQAPTSQSTSSSTNGSNTRNASFIRRGDGYGRRRRSPLNSGLWISIELVVTVSQIIASIVVLSLSRHENPQAPLFAWVVGYASGCVATLPLLYWRYRHRNSQGVEHDSTQHNGSSQSNSTPEPASYTAISVSRASEDEDRHSTVSAAWNGQNVGTPSARFNVLVDHFKMALDCFFAVWFVVGNVWIFGGHSSSSDAPNLYRLCIVFLTFSCIGYAMPFILCATICCCLPCIISILGFREDLTQTRGATPESINALPTYKFKLKNENGDGRETISSEGAGEGGVLAAGTEKERVISGEDAVCCICLARYADNEELRELPCSHFFHMECVDKWLKINALCPLCKCEVGEGSGGLPLPASHRLGERRLGNRLAD
ncbi:PREDICTED: E3 ubiquitin-protein ligase At1g63170-like [Nelumbo nucifera]|uniref:E3 ubiquitin-protein ligase At1g63170-like n=1 Tax=Nelumbo nucifera TaxID=4432 RepID=A0A1U7ZES7_NELNU|nr:PREDICTED: E3 ubiquitin-protein ligase At1g63170-like [Nelumbo nucifera]